MKLVQLTAPDHSSVWINPEQVIRIRSATDENPKAATVLDLTSGFQAVAEQIGEVLKKLKE